MEETDEDDVLTAELEPEFDRIEPEEEETVGDEEEPALEDDGTTVELLNDVAVADTELLETVELTGAEVVLLADGVVTKCAGGEEIELGDDDGVELE